MTLIVRAATPADIAVLSDLGRRTFRETFVEDFAMPYSAADMAEFEPRSYGEEVLAGYFADPAFQHFLALLDGVPVGYALVGPNGLPHEEASPQDAELKRIYLLRHAQGSGGGRALYQAAMDWLERDGPRRVWLGVWSGNLRAQAFYARNGFEKVGEYRFKVGETLDHEFIFRRG